MQGIQTDDDLLLGELCALEVELQLPSTRSDPGRLDALLHEDFREVGQSGTLYTKADAIRTLLGSTAHAELVCDRFELSRLAQDVALLTYRLARQCADGTLERASLRTSIWQRTGLGWQVRFHQATPSAPDRASP